MPAGINSDDTTLSSSPAWADGANVRFRLGRGQVVGGWESLTMDLLTGVCRTVFPWTDNAAVLNIAFGTHSKLQVWQGGALFDITPLGPPNLLGTNPFTVSNGSTSVNVHHVAHGLVTSNTALFANAAYVGRILIDAGPYTITKVDADNYTITSASAAVVAKTLGSNPLSTLINTPVVTVSEPGHNIPDGTTVVFAGATAVGGITPNGTFPISVVDADHYEYTFSSNASSSASGGGGSVTSTVPTTGGGPVVIETPQLPLPAGAIDGTGSAGYGTGAWGAGPYGETTLGTEYFPRTWSLSAWGKQLLASPRGGGLYLWQNDTGTPAAAVQSAPPNITHSLVAPMDGGYMAFALGTNEEASGVFNPMCIRHSSVGQTPGGLNQWSTLASGSTSREYILTGGGRIVAGRMCGPYLLVWTNDALWLGTFVGNLDQPWRFDPIARNCGLIGPNAAVVVGQTAFWISPDKQMFTCPLGGSPGHVPCPILVDFADNLAAAQGDKIVASSNATFSEIRFDYPDARDGFENSRFLGLCIAGVDGGAWHRGNIARTAFVDAGPTQYPVGVTFPGNVYFHEKGHSADGAAFSWFIESADTYLDIDSRLLLRQIWPDLKNQIGPVTITVTSSVTPEDPNPVVKSAPPMAPGMDKADILIEGRLFRVRYSGSSSPTDCRIGRSLFDVSPTGKR